MKTNAEHHSNRTSQVHHYDGSLHVPDDWPHGTRQGTELQVIVTVAMLGDPRVGDWAAYRKIVANNAGVYPDAPPAKLWDVAIEQAEKLHEYDCDNEFGTISEIHDAATMNKCPHVKEIGMSQGIDPWTFAHILNEVMDQGDKIGEDEASRLFPRMAEALVWRS